MGAHVWPRDVSALPRQVGCELAKPLMEIRQREQTLGNAALDGHDRAYEPRRTVATQPTRTRDEGVVGGCVHEHGENQRAIQVQKYGAVGAASGQGWADVRQHSASHMDTIADRVK